MATATPPTFINSQNRFSGIRSSSPQSMVSVNFRSVRISAYCSTKTGERFSIDAVTMTTPTLYDVLGIPTGATSQDIKAAYRRLVRVCHPDVVSIDLKSSSSDEFMRIHDAYSTLSDPQKRADYDRRILIPYQKSYSRPMSVSESATPSFSRCRRRTWETDQCW